MNYSRWLLSVSVVSVVFFSCGPGRTMQVNNKPVAGFKFTQSMVRPQVFAFDAAESTTTVGTLSKWKWLFGDEAMGAATTDVTTSATQHAYTMAGTFSVTLVVEDEKGAASDPVTKMVTVASVNNTGPMAIITGPSSGQPMMQLTFDGSTSTPMGDIKNYQWDFGDGTPSVSGSDKSIVQHTFMTAMSYRVTLTVTDSLGQNATGEKQVVVGDAGPLAVCSFMPTTMITQGSAVSFNGSQSMAPPGSMIQAYVWDFGDGVNNVPGMMVQHTYNAQGTFKPKLKVFDNRQPPRSHETNCPDVVVGAPGLCAGEYTWRGMGSALCSWSATTIMLTQMANGMMTITEPGPTGAPIVYSGPYTGNSFMLTGSYMGSFGETYNVTLNGTFNGCNGWTGTYTSTDDIIGQPCTSNVTATKL